jgi:signal transduction histidine kinase
MNGAEAYAMSTEFDLELFLRGLYQRVVTINEGSRRAEKLLEKVGIGKGDDYKDALMTLIRIISNTANKASESIKEVKKEGLRGMVHDVRNIMTGVITNTKVAAYRFEKGEYDELGESLRIIQKAALVAGKTIQSKSTDKSILQRNVGNGLDMDNQSLNMLLDQALEISRIKSMESVYVYREIPEEPIIIKKNGLDLLRVLMNLFNNASDALNDKADFMGQKISLGTIVTVCGEMLELKVIDNGIGMASTEGIFDKEFSTKDESGEGIGLYFCKKVVEEEFNGTISVKSGWRQGTMFTINIPLV